jgi:RNA polymerase sigma factor (sigma-70 family)
LSATDRELVSRFVNRGEEEAFRLLFRRHTPRVYAMSLRLMGGNAAAAEDVVQETWLRAAQRAHAFEWRSSLSTWLVGITINCAREALRARMLVDAGADATAVIDPRSIVPRDRVLDLEQAIAALPARQRLVLLLHDLEGWTHVEIGRTLEIAAGTSKSDLFHARRAIRARLQPADGGER